MSDSELNTCLANLDSQYISFIVLDNIDTRKEHD